MITLEAWLTSRPASTAASSGPGSEISSMMGSGDDVSDKLVSLKSHVNMADPRRRAMRVPGGHVTGSFAGVAVGPATHNLRYRSRNLARLNPY